MTRPPSPVPRSARAGFTLMEILVSCVLVVIVAGAAVRMSMSSSDASALKFDEQLATFVRTLPAAAQNAGAAVSVEVTATRLTASTGLHLTVPKGVSVTSTLWVNAQGQSGGYLWRVVPGVSCLRYGLQAYGTLERVAC